MSDRASRIAALETLLKQVGRQRALACRQIERAQEEIADCDEQVAIIRHEVERLAQEAVGGDGGEKA